MDYIIKLKDRYKLKDDKTIDFDIELNLSIEKTDMFFSGDLKCFSNTENKYVPLYDSIVTEFLSEKESKKCIKYYEDIKNSYLNYLNNTIKTKKDLDEYIEKVSNPKINYNYKLLNVFTVEELKYINNVLFKKYVVLDVTDFKEFKEQECDGWYYNGVEVNTDLDDNDYPEIIYSYDCNKEKTITPKEAITTMLKISKIKECLNMSSNDVKVLL